jgi:two-component system, NarL family, sensor kinase
LEIRGLCLSCPGHNELLPEQAPARSAGFRRLVFSRLKNPRVIAVTLDIPDDSVRLPSDIEMTLFRIVQEGTTNVHRHAGSRSATVRVDFEPDAVVLELADQGKGFAEELPTHSNGEIATAELGIRGMRERVKLLGSHFEISSSKQGTKVMATLPLPKA